MLGLMKYKNRHDSRPYSIPHKNKNVIGKYSLIFYSASLSNSGNITILEIFRHFLQEALKMCQN